jgi:tungstate transport system permease protein
VSNLALGVPCVAASSPILDPELGAVTWLSPRVSALAVLLAALAGVPLGAWLGLARFRGRRLLVALLYTGMALPPVVVGLAVYLLLSRSGPLGALGWLFTPQAMVLAQAVIALPIVAGLTLSAVAAVPGELPPQLRALGASPWQVRRAVLREARAGVLVALAAGFGRSISEVGAALLVGGNIAGQTRVLTTAIVLETGKGQFAVALALAGWLVMLALAVNAAILALQGRPQP